MNVLVTGGAGFIGSHLVDRMLSLDHRLTVLDNYSTGRRENLAHHNGNTRLTVEEKDIADFNAILDSFEGIDWVFHLAALADIVPSIVNPIDYYRSNVLGTANVLEASRRNGVKRFLYVASSSCYGIPENIPTGEDVPIKCEYPYALTKYIGEQTALHWNKIYSLPVVSLRLFNVYGPRSRTSGTYGAVFGVFIAQKLAGKPFTVIGDGTQTRDFTYVSDVIEAMTAAMESDATGEIFNVGSGGTYSINRLVELLGGDVIYLPKRPGEPDCTFADTTLIKNKLEWEAKVSFEEGVEIMLENIDYWRDAPVWDEQSIGEVTKSWFRYLG